MVFFFLVQINQKKMIFIVTTNQNKLKQNKPMNQLLLVKPNQPFSSLNSIKLIFNWMGEVIIFVFIFYFNDVQEGN